jgi:hypothetical protein
MKKLPIGLQTFSRLINEGYVYVDKTALIYQLITQGSYYFFSRPRRFGKSLLVSTLEAIFLGKKELFSGLAIDTLSYEWKKHPVIKISFAGILHTSPEILENGIKLHLNAIAKNYNVTLNQTLTSSQMLQALVIELSQQAPVVLLIDEYDYSILQHVHEPKSAESIRAVLKDFYAVIKDLDPYFRFVFLTGVSQFSKTSIFSGLNNLEDISLSEKFNSLLGYTSDEISVYFDQHLVDVSHYMNYSIEKILQEITLWYDGYCFSKAFKASKIYNPFSVLLCLKQYEFSNYWFATGTPTFLINLLKTKHYPMEQFEKIEATADELKQFDIDAIKLKTLLFQTGYLTIKGYDQTTRNYILGYVNKETTDSLSSYVIHSMADINQSDSYRCTVALLNAFQISNFDRVFETLTIFFANIPYTIQIPEEKYYQTLIYLILKMIGAHITVEQPTNIGRIDAVLETSDTYFIIEFKINTTAAKAIEQIEAKKYYQPYLSLGKKIVLVGIAFDTMTRNISEIKHKVFLS